MMSPMRIEFDTLSQKYGATAVSAVRVAAPLDVRRRRVGERDAGRVERPRHGGLDVDDPDVGVAREAVQRIAGQRVRQRHDGRRRCERRRQRVHAPRDVVLQQRELPAVGRHVLHADRRARRQARPSTSTWLACR